MLNTISLNEVLHNKTIRLTGDIQFLPNYNSPNHKGWRGSKEREQTQTHILVRYVEMWGSKSFGLVLWHERKNQSLNQSST